MGLRAAWRDYRRNGALWVLLLAVPPFFITVSFLVPPETPTPVDLVEGGRTTLQMLSLADALVARLGVVSLAVVLVSTVSLAVTAATFAPRDWITFAGATVATAWTYAMTGVLVGPVMGRTAGLYLLFLLPFLDVGIGQNAMFDAAPPAWAAWMPGYGAGRVLVDGAFTASFDESVGLALAVAWLIGLTLAAAATLRRLAAPAGIPVRGGVRDAAWERALTTG